MYTSKKPASKSEPPAKSDAGPSESRDSSEAATELALSGGPTAAGASGGDDPDGSGEEREGLGVLVDDGEKVGPGQVARSVFFDQTLPLVEAALEEELVVSGYETEDCPYFAFWVDELRKKEARELERVLARYAKPGVSTPEGLRDAIVARVREATRTWVRTGSRPETPSGVASSDAAAPEPGPSVQRWADSSARSSAPLPHPRAVQRRLGAGAPLDADTRTRMERGFGADFSDVRIHADRRGGALAEELGATAFAVGRDVGFAPRRYRPGSLGGDLLLAHELAHTLQQRTARGAELANGDDRALEDDANRSAARALLGAEHPLPRPGGLALQRCIEHDDLDEQAAEELIEDLELGLTITPEPRDQGKEALVGQEIEVDLTWGDLPSKYRNPSVLAWIVTEPDGSERELHPRPMTPLEYTLTEEGSYTFRIRGGVMHGDATQEHWELERSIDVVTPKLAAEFELADVTAEDYDSYRSSQEASLTLLSPGKQQDFSDAFVIKTAADNPVSLGAGASRSLSYAIVRKAGKGTTRFQWYLTPLKGDGFGDEHAGKKRVETKAGPAYDLGTGATTSFQASIPTLYVVRCEVRDARGRLVDEIRYLQSVLDEKQLAELREYEKQLARTDVLVERLHESQRLPLRAIHVSTDSGAQLQLRLFLGRKSEKASKLTLLDLTPGLDPDDHTLEYEGKDTDEVLEKFKDGNKYPEGAISLEVPSNQLGIATAAETFETDGATLWGVLSGGFGIGALVLGVLGLLAAPFTEGGSLVVTMLIVGSASAGVAAGAFSLVDRLQNESLSETGVALDLLSIAASFLGGAAAVKAARQGAAILVAGRSTRYLLWGSFATEAVSGVLVSVEGMAQIQRVLDDSKLDSKKKRSEIVRIIATLVVTGGLLALSYRDLGSIRRRLTASLGADLEKGLTPATRITLGNTLSDDALQALKGASKDDLERLAKILREDPTAAAHFQASGKRLRAALDSGAASTADMQFAVLRERLKGSGASGTGSQRVAKALQASDVHPSALVEIDETTLGRLKQIDDSLESGDVLGAIELVDKLPSSLMDDATRRTFESSLAKAHKRTDPSFYRKPVAKIAGKPFQPTARGGTLYHGTGAEPTEVFEKGLGARGPNTDLENHVGGAKDTAYRGATSMRITPDGRGGAAHWADEDGWVYVIDGTPSWDTNKLLQGRVRSPMGGFGGNPVHGELEHAIPAQIPPERIRGAYRVLPGTRVDTLKLGPLEPNPNYRSP